MCVESEEFGWESWSVAVLGNPSLNVGQWGQLPLLTLISHCISHSARLYAAPALLPPSLGWRGGNSHLLEPDTSLIAFPKQPLKRVCCKSNRRLQLEMVTEDNLATTRGLQCYWKVPLEWSPFRVCFCVWDGLPSVARRWRFAWGQCCSHKFLYSTQPLMPSMSFSALLKDTWLLHNNTRISQWVHGGRRMSLGTKYHFLHLSFNTFLSG